MLTEKFFISSERLEEFFNESFRKNVAYDNIKSHKKPGFHPPLQRYIFRKTTGGSQTKSPPTPLPPRNRFRVNEGLIPSTLLITVLILSTFILFDKL